MKRREFISLLAGGAAAWPLAARAQQPVKVARIGYLGFGPASAHLIWVEALRAGLRDLGYVEGKDIVIEFRWAERVDQLPEIGARLSTSTKSSRAPNQQTCLSSRHPNISWSSI
jgi:putative tryptophan/tyrosine transport system substrate-binding protein